MFFGCFILLVAIAYCSTTILVAQSAFNHNHDYTTTMTISMTNQDTHINSDSSGSGTPVLTSTTAPGKVFATRSELADHYKSDWHRYNLKRREAGLPLLLHDDFMARWQAAQAMRQDKLKQQQQNKTDHLSQKNKQKKQQKQQQQTTKQTVVHVKDPTHAYQQMKQETKAETKETLEAVEAAPVEEEDETAGPAPTPPPPQPIHIEPRQCLFDPYVSPSIHDNVQRMTRKYGFFLPDAEYLADLEGLLGYCHERIQMGHLCLTCHKGFATASACQKHMKSKQHVQLAYSTREDQEEWAVFYDFEEANQEFLKNINNNNSNNNNASLSRKDVAGDALNEGDDEEDGNEDGWEDVSEDGEKIDNDGDDEDLPEEEDGDDDLYGGYADQVAAMGFSVTVLGELIMPDGRIIGHRSLRRYYKQRPSTRNESTAVIAARLGAGERLYQGRVYNVQSVHQQRSESNALALSRSGIAPGMATGRSGKGILVASGPDGQFSQLSIYRYRAAVRKQRQGERKGQKLFERTSLNMNRMGKKDNRLMNGVSVAHAKR
jgi:pre-60S factor REI1